MKRDAAPAVTCLLIVLALGMAACYVADSAWNSVVHYQTPYAGKTNAATKPAGARSVERVILVIVDGLRLDTSRQLDFLNELRRMGADGTMMVVRPSLSNPSRATLATGATPEVHGITTNFAKQGVPVDSIFSLAKAAGLRTAATGEFWARSFKPFVDGDHWPGAHLAAIDLTAGDDASHDFGPRSAEAVRAYREIDAYLRKLVAAQNLDDTVLVVASDHGHIESGGHGGSEPEVMNAPVVIAGGPVCRGCTFRASAADIAPTICALLGLPLPATNQGRVLALAPQLERDAVAVWQPESPSRSRGTVTALAAAIVGLFGAWVFCYVLRSGAERAAAAGALATFYAVYFLLFHARSMGYSFSTVNREEYLDRYFLANMIFAAVALLMAATVMGVVARHAALRLAPAVAVLVSLSLALQVIVVHYLEGLWMTTWMPNLDTLFKAYLDMLAMMAVAFAVWISPAAVWIGATTRAKAASLRPSP